MKKIKKTTAKLVLTRETLCLVAGGDYDPVSYMTCIYNGCQSARNPSVNAPCWPVPATAPLPTAAASACGPCLPQ